MNAAERIAARVEDADGHLVWQGKVDRNGIPVTKYNSKSTTVRRLVWELANGPIPGSARVKECPGSRLCVRLEHLAIDGSTVSKHSRPRHRPGMGSVRQLRSGTWELRVTTGRWVGGRPRNLSKTVKARTETEALALLGAFVEETRTTPLPDSRDLLNLTVDQALEQFLTEYLSDEKGRADKTVDDYRKLHNRWFSPTIGSRLVKRVDAAVIDRLFGEMRQAGLSHSRLNQAKSLYVPFFRWAKRRGISPRNPMIDFEMPTSTYVSKERTPPEVEELALLLSSAVDVVPDVAPLLVLDAVSGMRRGELVGIRRSGIAWNKSLITVDSAIAESGKVKSTKTRKPRTFHVDTETLGMMRRQCELMDQRAQALGVQLVSDPFLFSLDADCARPMSPGYLTKRVGILKSHLGIEDKQPEISALEDEALRLRRLPPSPRPAGRTGPAPTGGMSFSDIGRQLNRSERWAALAVAAAERREKAQLAGGELDFDGSIVALRKFTSSELLDAGFNIGMVAQRQGHGPQVLARHYSKSRASADREAAEHLGRVVHGHR